MVSQQRSPARRYPHNVPRSCLAKQSSTGWWAQPHQGELRDTGGSNGHLHTISPKFFSLQVRKLGPRVNIPGLTYFYGQNYKNPDLPTPNPRASSQTAALGVERTMLPKVNPAQGTLAATLGCAQQVALKVAGRRDLPHGWKGVASKFKRTATTYCKNSMVAVDTFYSCILFLFSLLHNQLWVPQSVDMYKKWGKK